MVKDLKSGKWIGGLRGTSVPARPVRRIRQRKEKVNDFIYSKEAADICLNCTLDECEPRGCTRFNQLKALAFAKFTIRRISEDGNQKGTAERDRA